MLKRLALRSLLTIVATASATIAQSQGVCLQLKDFASWWAVDENSIVYTDRQGHAYTMRFRDNCPSGTRDPALVYRNMKRSGCITKGDTIDVTAGHIAPHACVVELLRVGAPERA